MALFLVGGLALLAGPARARLGDPPDLVAAGKSGDMALAKDAFLRNDDPDAAMMTG